MSYTVLDFLRTAFPQFDWENRNMLDTELRKELEDNDLLVCGETCAHVVNNGVGYILVDNEEPYEDEYM